MGVRRYCSSWLSHLGHVDFTHALEVQHDGLRERGNAVIEKECFGIHTHVVRIREPIIAFWHRIVFIWDRGELAGNNVFSWILLAIQAARRREHAFECGAPIPQLEVCILANKATHGVCTVLPQVLHLHER